MVPMNRKYAWALAGLGWAWACAVQAAPDVSLEVTHHSMSVGADGVRRSSDFSERVVRWGDTVWVERVLPPGAHQDLDHAKSKVGAAKDHKHADLSAATRWIQRGPDNKVRLRLVSVHDQVVVDVATTEFATVGFDGSWTSAYHLMDPEALKKFKPLEKTAAGQWFESPVKPGGNVVRILWDAQRELPVKVSTRNAQGNIERSTVVKVLPMVRQKPWDAVAKFTTKDYSDFLD